MKLIVKKGRTSLLVRVFIQDSSSTTGAGLTGLTSASSGLVCYRARDDDGNAGATQLSLSAGTRGTWSSGGFVEKDSTNMPGWYELGLDNAGLVTGSETVDYELKGAANMAPCVLEVQLVAYDPQDAVHLGLSALPNTAVTTNGSLITSGSGTDQLTVASGLASADAKKINAVSTSSVTTVNANQGTTQPLNFTGTGASALAQTDVTDWKAATAPAMTGDAFARLGAPAGASVSADIAAIKSDTGTILTDVNTGAGAIYSRLGAPAGASLAADVAAVKAVLPSALTGAGNMKSDVLAVNGGTSAASKLAAAATKIVSGTVGTGSSTTSIVTSALSPANVVAGQFQGRVMIFDDTTTTTALQGQATVIQTDNGSGTLTVTALTTAPVSGDTFTIT